MKPTNDDEPQREEAPGVDELQEQALAMVREAFGLLDGHFRRLTADLKDFEQDRDEVRKRIERGARRTSGRIV